MVFTRTMPDRYCFSGVIHGLQITQVVELAFESLVLENWPLPRIWSQTGPLPW